MPIQWNRDESKRTPRAANRPVTSPQSLQDVVDQLNTISLENSDNKARKGLTNVEAGMAKLHSVLDKSKLSENARLENTDRAAAYARESIVKAWKLVQEARQAATNIEDTKANGVEVFPFLALPTELRLLIYQELLVCDSRLVLNWRGPRRACKEAQKALHTSIMRTCKKCADEGATVLYGYNLFDFEEIRHRPFFFRTVSSLIGPKNASLIRFVVAEYPASYEELSQEHAESSEARPKQWNERPCYPSLSLQYITKFFQDFDVDLDQFRLLVISIVPFGQDDASMRVLNAQAPGLGDGQEVKEAWVQSKNNVLPELIDRICGRDASMKRTNFANFKSKLPLDWAPSFGDRHWIEYERRHPIQTKEKVKKGSLNIFQTAVEIEKKELLGTDTKPSTE